MSGGDSPSSEFVHSSEDYEPYQPPESLWQFIKSIANDKELDLLKRIIGESLVETSIDLHNEIDTLLEIWRDYRNETLVSLNKLKQQQQQQQGGPGARVNNLPEPPNVRETLKREIVLFVRQMREHFKEDDEKFCRQILANNHNLNVINYVLNSTANTAELVYDLAPKQPAYRMERPKSALMRDSGVETPVISRCSSSRQKIRYRSHSVRHGTSMESVTSSSRYSSQRRRSLSPGAGPSRAMDQHRNNQSVMMNEQLEFMVDEDKLNTMQIDDVLETLRELFQNECDTLLSDIEFLYECIYDESEFRFRSKQTMKEPTLNDLKEERKKLETDLMSATGKNVIQITKLPSKISIKDNNRSINSPVAASRKATPSPPSSAASNRSNKSTISINNINLLTNKTTNNRGVSPSTRTKPDMQPKIGKAVPKTGADTTTTAANRTAPLKLAKKIPPPNNENAHKSLLLTNDQQQLVLNSTGSSISNESKPVLSRQNSAASSVDSSSLSSASSTNRLNSAQKFRQMVFDWRD